MTRWDAFTALCAYLRAGFLGGERRAAHTISWEPLIEIASFHCVTPAVARCLTQEPDVPNEVREYFEAAAALNAERNEGMLAGLARVAGLLNAVGIEPLLLKGAALLAEEIYPEPATRLLGDVDIFLPADRAAEAQAALKAGGLAVDPAGVVPPPDHHHLQMLHDPETGVGVELHTDIVRRSPDAVIATAWFCEQARPVEFRGRRILLPEATRNAGHIIFHSQIFEERHTAHLLQLRHLLDLVLLRARYESSIDWGMLDARFSAANVGHVLADYLGLAEALFGQPAPKTRQGPSADAIEALRRMESRSGFHMQIDRLNAKCDWLQTELSRALAERDRYRSLAETLERRIKQVDAAREP